ncbi:hypothetical protein POM88_054971 [Heracleum sosnowskyi]|uniref:HAT C-terminal dimerisation domain-containing protein n=1 Tax=Heracleum sosnowskyi TaxID=360622 RepID=A0AAD8GM69_9APIA|nr:hypothetical protein POM88_054971 [Heracleum sosnowskyi]
METVTVSQLLQQHADLCSSSYREGIFGKDLIDFHKMQSPEEPEFLKLVADLFFGEAETWLNEMTILLQEQEVDYRKLEKIVVAFRKPSVRFPNNMVELLVLSSVLDPTDCFRSFDVEAICKLACIYYPDDFPENDKRLDVSNHFEFQALSTISELCQLLFKTKKSIIYPLLDRLIRLVLTLPVSTATAERTFSAMSFVKNKLRKKMEDVFLQDYLITYIEKEVAEKFDNDSIIEVFYKMKKHRLQLK